MKTMMVAAAATLVVADMLFLRLDIVRTMPAATIRPRDRYATARAKVGTVSKTFVDTTRSRLNLALAWGCSSGTRQMLLEKNRRSQAALDRPVVRRDDGHRHHTA